MTWTDPLTAVLAHYGLESLDQVDYVAKRGTVGVAIGATLLDDAKTQVVSDVSTADALRCVIRAADAPDPDPGTAVVELVATTINDGTDGQVAAALTASATSTPGILLVEWQADFPDGRRVRWPAPDYSVLLVHEDLLTS